MTSSSSTSAAGPTQVRVLDTMLLVYSMLQGHPAATVCEQFLTHQTGWCTNPLVLFEAQRILTRVYSVDSAAATQKLLQLCDGLVEIVELESASVGPALHAADTLGVDLTDAVLLQTVQQRGASFLATDDQRLAQACQQLGVAPVSPIDQAMRQQIAAWEIAHLAPKGLPRVLRHIHGWLCQSHVPAAQDFWNRTGAGSHLP